MAVTKEFKCMIHGFFESKAPRCPSGCSGDELIMRVFLTPVGTKSDRTKNNDANLARLAADFKMGDIKTTREGEAQPARFAKPPDNPYAIKWGSPADIGSYNTKPINGESLNGLELGRNTGRLKPVKPASVIKDHENLKINME